MLDTFDVSLTICSLVDLTSETVANLAKKRSNATAMAGFAAMPFARICRSEPCSPSRSGKACGQTDTGELMEYVG